MSAIIVGIHGLANKPPKDKLAKYWKYSIAEGLKRNCGVTQEFDLRMVYWADLLYSNALHENDLLNFDDLYNEEPYTPCDGTLMTYEEDLLDKARARASALVGGAADIVRQHFGMDSLTDWVLRKTLRDLAFYYDSHRLIEDRSDPPKEAPARNVLQGELKKTLLALKDNRIMLIAHSMGSIIAYDVLRDIGRTDSGFKVTDFVTIGSPLGLPYVKAQIIKERSYVRRKRDRLHTPTVVAESWVNYADRRDPVAFDTHLRDDFKPNKRRVRVKDDLIVNSYRSPAGKTNYHKSYGYLRAPELSKHISDFLSRR